jgi:hypothetical protein
MASLSFSSPKGSAEALPEVFSPLQNLPAPSHTANICRIRRLPTLTERLCEIAGSVIYGLRLLFSPVVFSRLERNSMKSILSLKPVAQSRKGVEYGSGPVMLYEVEGLPQGRTISIRNVRAQSQEPVWQFGAHFKGYPTRWTGAFKTAEQALAQLQENLDEADVEVGEVAQ